MSAPARPRLRGRPCLADGPPPVDVPGIRAELLRGFPDRLDRCLADRGMRGPDLARRIGVTAAAVRTWRAGTTLPQPELLAACADVLGVGRGWLAFGG